MPKYVEVIDIHDLKVNQILYSKLSPKQAIKVAQDFHDKHGFVGVVNTDIGSLRFDESYPLKYVFNNIFGKKIWKVKVTYNSVKRYYLLYVDDESGEVIGYSSGYFRGFFEKGVFSDSKIKVLNKDYDDLYPCYLKKSDYDDPDNVSRLKVLDKYRQEFVEKYPFYYPDENVSRKDNKLFGFFMRLFGWK